MTPALYVVAQPGFSCRHSHLWEILGHAWDVGRWSLGKLWKYISREVAAVQDRYWNGIR